MKGKKTACLFIIILCLGLQGYAFGENASFEKVNDFITSLKISITNTGEAIEAAQDGRTVFSAAIITQDGTLLQELRYLALSSDDSPPAKLVDMNFDGYLDISLTTVIGARNWLFVFALWNNEIGCFDPVMDICPWLPEENRFADKPTQLELCNYELLPENRQIHSEIADGYRYRTQTVYGWEGMRGICEDSVACTYDAGEGAIGEKLYMFGTGISIDWDEQYPESWYYGTDRVAQERQECIAYMTLGRATVDGLFMRVSGVDWVNLRLCDTKSSPSVAKLAKGANAQVLKDGCGEDGGWVRVLVRQGEAGVTLSSPKQEDAGLTGYIWHGFLETIEY